MATALQIKKLRKRCRAGASDVFGHHPENKDGQRSGMSAAEGEVVRCSSLSSCWGRCRLKKEVVGRLHGFSAAAFRADYPTGYKWFLSRKYVENHPPDPWPAADGILSEFDWRLDYRRVLRAAFCRCRPKTSSTSSMHSMPKGR